MPGILLIYWNAARVTRSASVLRTLSAIFLGRITHDQPDDDFGKHGLRIRIGRGGAVFLADHFDVPGFAGELIKREGTNRFFGIRLTSLRRAPYY